MSIIKNKEIYDTAQGNPVEVLNKYLAELDKSIANTTKLMVGLEPAIKNVNSTAGGKGAKTLTENIDKLNTATETLNKQNATRTKINNQIKKSEQQLVDLYEDEAQQLAEVKLELQERRAEMKKTAKDNKVAKDSLVGLNIELSKLRKKYDELSKAQRNDAKVGGKLLKNIEELDAETKQLSASTGRHQKEVGNYPKLFGGAGLSMKSLVGEFKNMGAQLLSAGSIIGGVMLLINGLKVLNVASKEIVQISKQLQGSFDLTKQEAKTTAAQIRALAATFDEDYNSVIKAATAVSKELDISVQEATDRIQEGFLKGSNTGGEFLNILQEYPAQFRAAGIDAETTFAIINQTAKEGIYSDKGIDAIKEGGLRLRENTKAVKEALAPLSESTRLQIEQEIAAGRSFDAIKLVSEALNDTSLTAEQTQKIIADVFGGAGEDAGLRYLKTLKDIDSTLEDVEVQASASKQSTLKLNQGWNDLVSGVAGNNVLTDYFINVKNTIGGILTDLGTLFDSTELKAKKLQTRQERQDAANKAAAQKRAEELKKQAAQDAIDEENRKKRFEEWKKRQAVIDANNTKELAHLIARTSLRDKEIEAIDRKADKEAENHIRFIQNLEEEDDALIQFQDVAAARELEADKRLLEGKAAIKEEAAKALRDITISNFNAEQDEKIAKIQVDAEREQQLLQDKLDNNLISQEEFEKKSKQIKDKAARESAKAERKKALFAIGINTIASVAKTFATLGWPAGIIPALAAASLGAIQLAKVAATPLPLKDGTEYVHGAGTETSDSIPAMLSKGERVVPSNINKLLGNISNDDLPAMLNANFQANDNSRIENALNKSNILNQRMVSLLENSIDSYIDNGVLHIIRKDGTGTEEIIQNEKI